MVKLSFLIICSIITIASILFTNKCNKQNISELALENIEALARNEGGTDHYWCCGNTKTCASGPGFEIKGKFQENPCK